MDVRNYRAVEKLDDDTPVTIRAIRRDDWPAILAAFHDLDPESVYTRFFTHKKGLTDAEREEITDVDFDRVVALVVTTTADGGERLIGGGRYAVGEGPQGAHSAELAFLTSNAYRGRGVAGLVLSHLIRIGRERGVHKFEASVLAQNQAMSHPKARAWRALPSREPRRQMTRGHGFFLAAADTICWAGSSTNEAHP
jgi:RimJ/RimL family protein N-acetyltransferase